MHSLTTLAAVAACILPTLAASPTIQLGFTKHKAAIPLNRLTRRQTAKTVNSAITNEEYLYLINTTVGTPPQAIGLQLDTGSSDIWFPSSSAPYCEQQGGTGCPVGSYDQSASSTYSDPGYGEFEISYVDGTQISGQYINDDISIGGVNLTNVTMASATQTGDEGFGIMGIGFPADESSDTGGQGSFTYPNIIDKLVSEGKINTRSYSLWLDDLNANTGSILFGGVDSSKYSGSLIAVAMQPDIAGSNIYTSFTVAWTGLTVTGGSQTSNVSPSSPQPAILDSGTTELLLPDSIANSIYNGVGVITNQEYGNVVPCGLANDSLTFAFQFGGSDGPTINVPVSEFVLPLETTSGRTPRFSSGEYKGQAICTFGIEAAGSDPILFGDTFLRSAYVVYDLDNKEVAMAQSNFGSSSSEDNVKVFTSGSGIPDATTTITSVVVSQTVTSLGPGGGYSTYTATDDSNGNGAVTRTATYSLTTASSTGGSSSSSHNAAPAVVPSIEKSAFAAIGATMVAFIFGTMML